jgi:undecaprenyl-diphosphatase
MILAMHVVSPQTAFAWLRSFFKQEALLVISILLIVGSIWTFAEVADEIEEGEVDEVDVWVMDLLHHEADSRVPIGPEWLITAALDLTSLGSTAVLIVVVALVAGYLGLRRQFGSMWLVVIASGLGQVLSSLLKQAFGRTRPDEMLHLAEVQTASFPSGHATLSAVVYLTLGAVLASTHESGRDRIYIMATALLLTGIVGLSRIYIGVHYTTDVLGGWSIGLCWSLICLLIARQVQRRHARRDLGEHA